MFTKHCFFVKKKRQGFAGACLFSNQCRRGNRVNKYDAIKRCADEFHTLLWYRQPVITFG